MKADEAHGHYGNLQLHPRKESRGLFLPRFHRLPSHVFPEKHHFLSLRRVQRSYWNRVGDIFSMKIPSIQIRTHS